MTERPSNPEKLSSIPKGEGIDTAVSAARRVVESLLHTGDGTAMDMTDVAERLTSIADDLDKHAPRLEQRTVDMWHGDGMTRHDPVTGPENAIAPPLELVGCDDGSVSGVVTLGLAYQGPPGCVHGGVSALLLDHTLGVANHWAGLSGMTAELTVRYRRPTPLFEPLTVAGKQVKVDGRKIWTDGSITDSGGDVCVEVDGFFIAEHLPRPR